jgi:hypothetical protein
MSAGGVIPTPAERARVAVIGEVTDLSGARLSVGVRGGCVVIRGAAVSGHVLNREQCETLAQLFVRAVWLTTKEE